MRQTIVIILLVLRVTFLVKAQASKEITTKSGLRYIVLKSGDGEVAKTRQEVAIYESMSYLSGKQLYSLEKPAPQ